MTSATALPQFMTVDEIGAELWPTWDARRRRKWTYRQVERGMPATRFGRALAFNVVEVAEWIATQSNRDQNGVNGTS